MILISHRGNLEGKQPKLENHPNYIDKALKEGYDVEIDVWVIENDFYLGHDEPQYKTTQEWLNRRCNKLWIHCKNIEAVEWFNSLCDTYNYFWHQEDTLTLTSKGYMWVYPGKQPINQSIAVMPELFNDDTDSCLGICSDYISKYKQ